MAPVDEQRQDDSDVRFGEQGARLTYGSYLRLPQLLDSQHLESEPPAHDELLFITIHQVYELWFQQLLHEAETVRDRLVGTVAASGGRDLWFCRHLLSRMHVIERVLVQQVDVLETMTPQDFLEFRQRLAPASGFQSVQFRELEFLSGAKDPEFLHRFRGLTEDEDRRLRRRLGEPTLWDGFVHVLGEAGLDTSSDEAITASLRTVAHDRSSYADVWGLAEALLQHDELAAAWRARHVVMVERMIGGKTGTGGSTGADYLRGRLDLRYYPLLWEPALGALGTARIRSSGGSSPRAPARACRCARPCCGARTVFRPPWPPPPSPRPRAVRELPAPRVAAWPLPPSTRAPRSAPPASPGDRPSCSSSLHVLILGVASDSAGRRVGHGNGNESAPEGRHRWATPFDPRSTSLRAGRLSFRNLRGMGRLPLRNAQSGGDPCGVRAGYRVAAGDSHDRSAVVRLPEGQVAQLCRPQKKDAD